MLSRLGKIAVRNRPAFSPEQLAGNKAAPISAPTQPLASSAARLTVVQHHRVRTRGVGNLSVIASSGSAASQTVVYAPTTSAKDRESRTVSAHIIHGSDRDGGLDAGATNFWAERRDFNVPRWRQRLYPAWDRAAQALITITRPQRRDAMLPEMAFRTMALFLKMLTMGQVAELNRVLLPGRAAQGVENVVGAAKAEAAKKEPAGGGAEQKKDDAANAAAPPSAEAQEKK